MGTAKVTTSWPVLALTYGGVTTGLPASTACLYQGRAVGS
jgi:hypothetical protein